MKKVIYLISFCTLFSCGEKVGQKSPEKTTFSEFKNLCRGAYTSTSFCTVTTNGLTSILDWKKELNCGQSNFKTIGWIKYSELSQKDQQLISHFYQWDDSENDDCKIELDLDEVLIGGCYTESLTPDRWSISKGIIILYMYDKNENMLYRITNNDFY
ncbi:MAG: hypothetical protein K0B10_14205 [Vicingaceae bacterium]|nr:hypothetical protein [Vicingaceae bacterium]